MNDGSRLRASDADREAHEDAGGAVIAAVASVAIGTVTPAGAPGD